MKDMAHHHSQSVGTENVDDLVRIPYERLYVNVLRIRATEVWGFLRTQLNDSRGTERDALRAVFPRQCRKGLRRFQVRIELLH